MIRFVEEGWRPSRHKQVGEQTWLAVRSILPGARRLAGTFPLGSGPNCFATAMAAAGVPGAAQSWMQREPFEEWPSGQSHRRGRDDQPGTLLVWRDRCGLVEHVAVTLGDGWALHKPSQGWMTPTTVLTVQETIYSARTRGRYLKRYSLN